MELGQQVAVGQGQLIPIQELASRHLVIILSGAGVNLLWQRRVQIVVQLLQRLGQASLKSWRGTAKQASLVNLPAPGYSYGVFRAKGFIQNPASLCHTSPPATRQSESLTAINSMLQKSVKSLKKQTLTKQ